MPSVYRTPLLVAIAGGASYDMRQTLLLSFEIVEIFLVTLVALFTTYHFVAQPFLVQGASMEPN
ncbi:MAG: S26 family signal peptidase, partial [Candidatus Colwellbacteria bacterium]|nr:S26 family signal peptidase [Candidatus Colwellbacteria bacterium]